MKNVYLEILDHGVLRLLSMYNVDEFSSTYGIGDREYWGWKIKDFANGTMQGGVHSLAIAIKLNLFDDNQKRKALQLVNDIILSTRKITYNNGSLEESYPRENSFCVTALVAFDILSAIYHLELDINKYKGVIKPMIDFITHNNEEHAVISNHLATGAAAIVLWNYLTGDNNNRYKDLLNVIYKNQSNEGWYKEYEGADPGYQTLATHYLFSIYTLTKDEILLKSLEKSAEFLKYFIHPDGTMGGLYGSRNTEVYYPGGVVGLSAYIPDFAMIAKYLEPRGQHILPQHIDIGNFVPLLNSYAVAALYYEENRRYIESQKSKPFWFTTGEKDFPESGIHIFSNDNYFAIVNYKKGGTLKVFDKSSLQVQEDGGIFGKLENGKKFSTQMIDEDIDFKDYAIKCKFYLVNEEYPTPLHFMVLRFLSLTLFRSVLLGNIFKKLVVRRLMTGREVIGGYAIRRFIFEEDKVVVEEKIVKPKNTAWIGHVGKSRAIHMASSGYFSNQFFSTCNHLVEFKNLE